MQVNIKTLTDEWHSGFAPVHRVLGRHTERSGDRAGICMSYCVREWHTLRGVEKRDRARESGCVVARVLWEALLLTRERLQ